jgi:hypothetical protein
MNTPERVALTFTLLATAGGGAIAINRLIRDRLHSNGNPTASLTEAPTSVPTMESTPARSRPGLAGKKFCVLGTNENHFLTVDDGQRHDTIYSYRGAQRQITIKCLDGTSFVISDVSITSTPTPAIVPFLRPNAAPVR